MLNANFGIEQPPAFPNQNYTITQPANSSSLYVKRNRQLIKPRPTVWQRPRRRRLRQTAKTFNIVAGAANERE